MKKKDLVKLIVDQSIETIQKYGIEAVDVYMQIPMNIALNVRNMIKEKNVNPEAIESVNELIAFQLKYYYEITNDDIESFYTTEDGEWIDKVIQKGIKLSKDEEFIEADLKRKREAVKSN